MEISTSTTSSSRTTPRAAEPSTRTRRRLIPVWLTVLAVALGLFATAIGLSALINPTMALGYVPGAENLATTWAGRNLGLGVVLLVAVALRNPYAYVVAFAGQLAREISDIVTAFPNAAGIAFAGAFLAVDVIGVLASARAVRASNRSG